MSLVDPLHVVIALVPLATYLIVLGLVNLSSRPLVISGSRDAAALAIAIGGLVVAGPMELFLVEEAAVDYGSLVWAMMLTAYGLFAALVILLQRPRVVIYNANLEQLRPLLTDVVARLDSQARWAGESLDMPQLGVHLHLEFTPLMNNVQLISAGPDQNLAGWKQLERELSQVLRKIRHRPNMFGALATLVGFIMAAGLTYLLARDPGGMMHAMNDMLRR